VRLPDDDERYLTEKGFGWTLLSDNAGACLVLRNYPIDAGRYEIAQTDIMVRIPAQYPMAALDMFYADPAVKLRGAGYPQAAEAFEQHCGRNWQRFSRHLATPWRIGVDGIASFLAIIARELAPDGAQP
jgi:hypothetical protein